MSAQRCLVTGASGFIGGRLVERLVREGYAVRCLARETSDTSKLGGLDVELAVGDLTQAHTLAPAVAGVELVFHCGALVSDWATRQEITAVNVHGTRALLQACSAASVRRLVHFSSTDVYGYPGGSDVDESYIATRFRNWYAQTKLDAEAVLRDGAREAAPETVILRPATVYGPGSIDVVGEIARAIRARHMLLIDHGRPLAGLCYVENLIDAALLAAREPAAAGEAFNVSDGLEVTWKRFTEDLSSGLGYPPPRLSVPYALAYPLGFLLEHGYRLLRSATGLSIAPLLSRQAVHVLGCNQGFSNRKARQLLGWAPRVEYASGLAATIAWLRNELA